MTIILVSIGGDGYPHAVPMWFIVDDDGCVSMTTYGRSQKAVNLRRNPQVALLVESGVRYDELKGVLIRGYGRGPRRSRALRPRADRDPAKHMRRARRTASRTSCARRRASASC